MKALILSCNTGEGHNSAARAMLEQFRRNGTDCTMLDTLSLASPKTSRTVSRLYTKTATKAPRLFGFCYKAGGLISSPKRKSPVYYANKLYAHALYDYITEHGYDTVVMPHLFPAQCLTYLRQKHGLRVASYIIATDYTCIPFWEETEADAIFIPHRDLAAEFTRKGIPAERLIPTGIPVSEKFLPGDQAEARVALGLPKDAPILLVMTGSMGYGKIENMLDLLCSRVPLNTRIFVFGGNNEQLKQSLREKYAGEARITVLDYTDRVPEYMRAADLLLTKPGGLTSTEAAVANIPLVHTHPIPGCETCNAAFFSARGMSLADKDEARLIDGVVELLHTPALREEMRAQQRKNIHPYAAREIYEIILQRGEGR